MPLVAEIPALKMSRADRFRVLTAEDPASLMAEAYRSLRTSIIAMWQRHPHRPRRPANGDGNGGAASPAWRPLRTLLITSPGPAEGKSVSAVNLAATFAETGASVIVIDADFRRPQLDRYFQRQAVPNLGDLGLDMTTNDFEAVLQDTNIPGVRFAASSPPKSSPGTAMAVAKAAVGIAKELADIVIIDSPPLLLANDASDLSTFADATVLLVRAGWTRHKAVAGAADLLRRLEATTVGVVLVGAEHGTHDGYYGYYGYYGYGYGYGRGESVEESLRHRLMPWRRPRPGGAAPLRGRGHGGRRVGRVRDGQGCPHRTVRRRALGLNPALSTWSTVAASARVLSPTVPVRRAPGVLWREGEFGVVVLGPGEREPQTLTGTGRALWHALARPIALERRSSPSWPRPSGLIRPGWRPILLLCSQSCTGSARSTRNRDDRPDDAGGDHRRGRGVRAARRGRSSRELARRAETWRARARPGDPAIG